MSKEKTKGMVCAFLITLVGAAMFVAMLFLPYASATESERERLLEYADSMYVAELEMTNADAADISLVEYFRMYQLLLEEEYLKEIAMVCMGIIGAFALFTVLTLLMAVLKKPIGILLFDLLALGVYRLIAFDFEDRGVISGGASYEWGIAGRWGYLAGVIVIVGAIWLLIEKIRAKRLSKAGAEIIE